MNRLPDALMAYDAVIVEHPENVVARNGRAEVLKTMNRLTDALAAYDAVIAEHPGDMVARRGRAELLKTMNGLPDALAAYDAVISKHPEDVVARAGRAEVLKTMNRLPDALAAYEAVIAEHPESVVARTGCAEVLKTMNRLPDALAAYDAIVAEHPEDVVARTGRACVLIGLKRFEEALEHLPVSDPLTADDWIGFHVRGMVLLRQGNLDGAISIFEEGARSNPRPAHQEYFRSALAVARIKQKDFASAKDCLKEIQSPTLRDPVNILLVHAFGELGETTNARNTFQELTCAERPRFAEVCDELRRRYIDQKGPGHLDDWLIDREIEILIFN
jgi:tetratricopeptide (TPR) repeat protein